MGKKIKENMYNGKVKKAVQQNTNHNWRHSQRTIKNGRKRRKNKIRVGYGLLL